MNQSGRTGRSASLLQLARLIVPFVMLRRRRHRRYGYASRRCFCRDRGADDRHRAQAAARRARQRLLVSDDGRRLEAWRDMASQYRCILRRIDVDATVSSSV